MLTSNQIISSVPRVTLVFWILKILATTLGESLADNMASKLDFGFLLSTVISAFTFAFFVRAQAYLNSYHTLMYWRTIVATAVLSTSLSDFIDKYTFQGHQGGVAVLFTTVVAYFLFWKYRLGSVSIQSIVTPAAVYYYWGGILLTQSLGNALGDLVLKHPDAFHQGRIAIFGALVLALLIAYTYKIVSGTLLFWVTFVFTRPIATDFGLHLHLPTHKGGLALTGFSASLALLLPMILILWIANPKPEGSMST